MRKKKLIILGLIKNDNNEFLLSQRYDPDVLDAHLRWDLPGGTNEFGEGLEETLKREILEETGLEVEIKEMLPKSISRKWKHKDYSIHVVVFCYYCSCIGGNMHPKDHKINDLKWIKKEDFKNYDFLPTTRAFIDMV
ncbi:MAG: NUDIX domain-containing protein [Patescibacteria group bacterium]